ncbi:MAG: FAD-dependent oxidoreductase [Dehalococcoidia bacterium]|nr:FAD-dependent oxidoreductase [Dehalococcoidia bacterium]
MTTPAPQLKHLFTPLKIGAFTVKNRVVSTGHLSNFAVAGLPSERHFNYWVTKAKGGVGLIVTEDQAVHPSGGSESFVIQAYRDECIEPFRRITSAVHEHGAKIVAQLFHPGSNFFPSREEGLPLWSAGPISAGFHVESTHEMDKEEIREVLDSFASCAVRMKGAGFDGVELMGAHGFLMEQFFSPRTNRRTDEYGGSEENRLRFGRELLAAVRQAVGPDFTVGMRVSGDQFQQGGLTLDDMKRVCGALADTGDVDYISVSIGVGGSVIPPMYVASAAFVYLAAGIKEEVDIPVFCAGRVVDPLKAEEILAKNQADMVAMTRACICDPELPLKAQEGRLDEIRYCIGCNEGCWGRSQQKLPISCALNPSVGREEEMKITPAPLKKKVMVIGGGIAGMEAARVAALRGHTVTLYEQGPELGGQLQIAARAPGRQDMAEPVRYYTRQFELLNVDVRLGTEVTPEVVEREAPDAVVVATGGVAARGSFPGSDNPNVVLARDVLAGKAQVGKKVIVYSMDRSTEGFTAADYLLEAGHEVELLIPHPIAPLATEQITFGFIMMRIARKNGRITMGLDISSFDGSTLVLGGVFGSGVEAREGIDTIVVSRGSKANDGLYKSLKGRVKELYLIGQALAPRKMLESTLDGLRVARTI